jgi:prepilin-type processing-associated H-X9-DG protein
MTYYYDGTVELNWIRILDNLDYVDKTSDVLRCPYTAPEEFLADYYTYGMRYSSYVLPGNVVQLSPQVSVNNLNNVDNPSEFFYFMDTVYGGGSTRTDRVGRQIYVIYCHYRDDQIGTYFHHSDKSNTWFIDGHSESIFPEKFRDLVTDQMNDPTMPVYINDANLQYFNVN